MRRRYFNPRSPCGERPIAASRACWSTVFQSTLPVWGATLSDLIAQYTRRNFNPRSPCGERLKTFPSGSRSKHFNPRSPCGERPLSNPAKKSRTDFNPRSPCGERLDHVFLLVDVCIHFNPRSPCGERLRLTIRAPLRFRISIHAPRVGSDPVQARHQKRS